MKLPLAFTMHFCGQKQIIIFPCRKFSDNPQVEQQPSVGRVLVHPIGVAMRQHWLLCHGVYSTHTGHWVNKNTNSQLVCVCVCVNEYSGSDVNLDAVYGTWDNYKMETKHLRHSQRSWVTCQTLKHLILCVCPGNCPPAAVRIWMGWLGGFSRMWKSGLQ